MDHVFTIGQRIVPKKECMHSVAPNIRRAFKEGGIIIYEQTHDNPDKFRASINGIRAAGTMTTSFYEPYYEESADDIMLSDLIGGDDNG